MGALSAALVAGPPSPLSPQAAPPGTELMHPVATFTFWMEGILPIQKYRLPCLSTASRPSTPRQVLTAGPPSPRPVQLLPPATVLMIPWPLNGAAAMASVTTQSTKRILIVPPSCHAARVR